MKSLKQMGEACRRVPNSRLRLTSHGGSLRITGFWSRLKVSLAEKILSLLALSMAAAPATATTQQTDRVDERDNRPVVVTSDVDLFFSIYDAADGHPSAEQLQQDYLNRGSEGLQHFASIRRITGERIARAIEARPEIYADARRCAEVLPQVRERVGNALSLFSQMRPEAVFPPVTVSIGRGRPAAVAGPTDGINIGLEALCATDFINPDIEDRFVRVMVHEFVHTQQSRELMERDEPTVLEASLMEGAAEFITELLTGDIAYEYMADLVRGREMEIEAAFVADMHKTDLSDWAWNSTAEKPADLGYWVGYRIAKAHYETAGNKHEAVNAILDLTDAQIFLETSGWRTDPEGSRETRPVPR